VSVTRNITLSHRKLFAHRDPELQLDEVCSRYYLRNRVFDLDARVDLKKVEIATRYQELRCPSVVVTDRFRRCDSRLMNPLAHIIIKKGRWRLFDKFLVSPLRGAISSSEVHNIPMLVAEKLHLYMPRPFDKLLTVHLGTSKVLLSLGPRPFKRLPHLFSHSNDAHPSPSAAGGGFNDDRKADTGGRRDKSFIAFSTLASRRYGNSSG
jgi:hypothetical protein